MGAPPQSQLPSSCQRQSSHRFMSQGRSCWVLATSGLTPRTQGTGGGRGQVGVQPRCSPVAPRVSSGFPSCRVSMCGSGPDSKLVFKGSLRFFLFRLSLSLFSSHRDKEKLVKDRLLGGGGACPAPEGFRQGFLTRSAAWRSAGRERETRREKQQTLAPASACRWKGRSACASLVRTGKSKCPR